MMETGAVPVKTLPDAWEPAPPIPLDRYLERQRFSPGLMAFLTLIVVIILFHIVIGPIAMIGLLMLNGISLADLQGALEEVIADNARILLVANTIGQFFALALPTYLILRLHTSRPWAFVRLRRTTTPTIALSLVGLAVLTPVVWWLGSVNEAIPLPEWIEKLEQSQVDLIEQVLVQDLGVVFSLFVMALTPAFCEELLFRGYVQRQLERQLGVVAGIVIIGVLFGLFHFRFSQVIPLSVIGMYLAYLTWRTGSLWPAIAVHFVNNSFALLMGMYVSRQPDMDLESLEQMDVPVLVTVVCTAAFAGIVYVLHRRASLAAGKVEA
ncbi:MAG: type II CAAX endopeptidase family protein [Rhodothermales bacterium]